MLQIKTYYATVMLLYDKHKHKFLILIASKNILLIHVQLLSFYIIYNKHCIMLCMFPTMCRILEETHRERGAFCVTPI